MKIKDKFEDIISKESWLIKEKCWNLDEQPVRETQFTLGNGYICSRGVLEEIPYDSGPGTYMAGLYDKTGSQVTEIVNLPNPFNFKIMAQGEKVDMIAMDASRHERILDMRKGLLKRRTVCSNSKKEYFDYQSLRFLSMANPHIGVIQAHFTPLTADTDIMVETFVDTSMTNKGILSEGRKRHFEVNKLKNEKFFNYIGVRTFQKKISVGYASHLEVSHDGRRYTSNERIIRFHVIKGETITFTKIFAIHSSRDLGFRGRIESKTIASLKKSVKMSIYKLLKQHIEAWRKKWDMADIDIKPDANLQAALRFNIYHLLICGTLHDSRSSIPARTLSGEGYRGHIFWDTEIFILPFFIYIQPQIARNLLYYRYRTLPAARRNARERGYSGALFSWESADTGEEATPGWHRDLDGKVIKIYTGIMEHHIAADVAYGVNQYYTVTGDSGFMLDAGLEIIFETARFWASRVTYNKSMDSYSIKNVIGPDEFHTNINDNAFTNIMARWNLVKATQLYREYEKRSGKCLEKIVNRIKLKEGEVRNWARISNRIAIPIGKNGIIESFRGFFKRKYMPIKELDDNFMPALPKNISLRRIKKTQFVKQADAVMIFHLFPESYPHPQRKKNYIYYDKRTLHKSSLSASMYALTGWEAGVRAKALHYFMFSLYNDLENKHGNSSEGIHAASLGGNWQAVFHGFAGIRAQDGILKINPSLPRGINSLHLKARYNGWLLKISIDKKGIKIFPASDSSTTLKICAYERIRILRNGQLSKFSREKKGRA